MIISRLVCEPDNWHVERIKATKIEFSNSFGGILIIDEGVHAIPSSEVLCIVEEKRNDH